jgi:hypothetical protein
VKIVMRQEGIEDGTYMATFNGLEEFQGDLFGEFYKHTFTILGGKYNGRKINGITSTNSGDESKLFKWLSAISGSQLSPGQEINSDELVGNRCRIVVKRKPSGNRTYSNVIDVLNAPIPDDGSEEF